MRAEADLIVDSSNPELIQDAISVAGAPGDNQNHVRLLSEGRIYHVLLFRTKEHSYAHLRFSYRSSQADGSITFSEVTDFNGAEPVKDCPGFVDFEKRWLAPKTEAPGSSP